MSSSVDFIQPHQPTVYTSRALWYIHNFFNQQKWPTGFAYEVELRGCNLDFSVESLKRIDDLIDRIRGKHTPNETSFLSHDRNQNFLFFIAFYCGELVGRARQQTPVWYSYPDFLDTFPQMQGKIPQAFANYLIVRSLKNEHYPKDTVWFPLTAVYERLFYPEKNKSIYETIRALLANHVDDFHCFQDLKPYSLPLDMPTEIAKYPQAGLGYLQIVPPTWLKNDELYLQIENLANLYARGRVTLGAIVPNQEQLQVQDVRELVVDVVYDPQGRTDIETLQEVAKNLAQLASVPPTNQQDAIYSQHLQQRQTRLFNYDVSKEISSSPLKVSTMFVWRPHLPDGRFALNYCPILVDDYQGVATLLPAYFWRETELYKRWRKVSGSVVDSLSLAFYQYSMSVPDVWQREFASIVRPRPDEIPSLGQYMTEEMILVPKSDRDDRFIQNFYAHVAQSSEIDRNEDLEIIKCAEYLMQGLNTQEFSASIIQKARMRLHDFSPVLQELADPQLNQFLGKQPLLQVDKAIHYRKLTVEQISQLLSVLHKGIQQGNSNAMMYLAYLNLVGLFVPQSVEQADQLIMASINTGDWRAIAFKAERLIADHADPTVVVQVLEDGIAQGHPTLHTRLAKFALELTKSAPAQAPQPMTQMPSATGQHMAPQAHSQQQFAQPSQASYQNAPQQFAEQQAQPQMSANTQHSQVQNGNVMPDVLSDEERKMQLYEMLRKDKEKWNEVTNNSKLNSKSMKMMGIVVGLLVALALILSMMK